MVLETLAPRRSLLFAGLLASMFSGTPTAIEAAPPEVQFDTANCIAVRDVTTHDFALLNPGEKLIEATWLLSALVVRGSDADLDEIIITMYSPERRGRVIDFWPRTEMTHDIIGPVQTTSTAEQRTSFKLNVAGGWLGAGGPVNGAVDANKSQQQTTNEQFQRLPARTAVIASGTMSQGYGAFFKLRRWSQAALEGAHEFRLLLAVPQSWRGDWMIVRGQARGSDRSLFGTNLVDAGEARFAVGMHLEADPEARRIVEQFVRLRRQQPQPTTVPLPRLTEMLNAKSAGAAARRDHEQAVTESLRAVRTLSGTSERR